MVVWLSDLLWREEPMTLVADSHALLKQAGFLYTATYYWYEPRERPLPEPEQCVPCTIRPKVHTESILVYRKPGDMTPPSADILEASRISPEECRESQMTLWTPSPTLDHPYKRIVRSWSFAGELILNPFSGQGAVAVCAAQLGRRCATIELNPRFCAHIVSYLKDSVPDMEPR
jgi:hypothetical protein